MVTDHPVHNRNSISCHGIVTEVIDCIIDQTEGEALMLRPCRRRRMWNQNLRTMKTSKWHILEKSPHSCRDNSTSTIRFHKSRTNKTHWRYKKTQDSKHEFRSRCSGPKLERSADRILSRADFITCVSKANSTVFFFFDAVVSCAVCSAAALPLNRHQAVYRTATFFQG